MNGVRILDPKPVLFRALCDSVFSVVAFPHAYCTEVAHQVRSSQKGTVPSLLWQVVVPLTVPT